MALEEKIDELTAAVKELTATLKKGGTSAAAPSGDKKGPGRPPKESSKFTQDQVKASLLNVKENVGTDEAKRIISEVGGAKDLADLLASKKAKWDDVMTACDEAVEGGGEEDEGDGL